MVKIFIKRFAATVNKHMLEIGLFSIKFLKKISLVVSPNDVLSQMKWENSAYGILIDSLDGVKSNPGFLQRYSHIIHLHKIVYVQK